MHRFLKTDINSLTQTHYIELVSLIEKHDYNYHVLDNPEITDKEYDLLFQLLLKVESLHPNWKVPTSPSERVGGKPLSYFEKHQHSIAMLSLSNSYESSDLFDFDKRVKNFLKSDDPISYFCEPKFDGLSMEIIYEHGVFTKAITRGDGTTGEVVTQNIRTIKSLPLRLHSNSYPEYIEIRGEVLIHKEDFLKLNNYQQSEGLLKFANPRNAASGSVRQLDSKITQNRPLKFYAYGLGKMSGNSFKFQHEIYSFFKKIGIPTYSKLTKVCESMDEVVRYYEEFSLIRHQLPFDVDGIVVKVDNIDLQKELGEIAKSPRWATAAKFNPEQESTVIEDIQCQVGRTGAITPVAIMKPVNVGGVVVTNATLHNQEEIDRKDIRIGDTVIVQRAGDVIPEIVEVDFLKRPIFSVPYKIPEICPGCGGKIILAENESIFRCVNENCPSILKESLKHFASKRAMNIEKLGDKWIEIFVDKGLIKDAADFYLLKKESLLTLERQGEKSADNIIKNIEKSKDTTLSRFIFALGIRFVGETTAQHLSNHYENIDNFMNCTEETLLNVPEIGPKIAVSILSWLKNNKSIQLIKKLLSVGIKIKPMITDEKRTSEGPLKNLTFLITGTLPISRDNAEKLIEDAGGRMVSSVSSKLNYLIVGESPGSKLTKAKNLGIPIVSWDKISEMITTN